jgi:LuxR family maltose regulon positive regulatory protein
LVGTAVAHVGLGDVLREWNDLDGAVGHLMAGIELGERQGDVVVGPGLQALLDGYLALARVYGARKDAAGALETIHRAEQVAQRLTPLHIAQVAAARARLWIAQDDLTATSRWAQECGLALSAAIGTGVGDEPSHEREFEYLTVARALIAQGEADKAVALLAPLGRAAEAAERMRSTVEILALQAVALRAQGDTRGAMNALERALSLAEPEGYVRTFVDEGAPMEALLRNALSQGIASGYVRNLLAAFSASEYGSAGARHPGPHAQSLAEPLSPREVEVLRLIADGSSNREIAEELFIATTTVKKHVSNILGKLGVTNRTRAVARARELGLL